MSSDSDYFTPSWSSLRKARSQAARRRDQDQLLRRLGDIDYNMTSLYKIVEGMSKSMELTLAAQSLIMSELHVKVPASSNPELFDIYDEEDTREAVDIGAVEFQGTVIPSKKESALWQVVESAGPARPGVEEVERTRPCKKIKGQGPASPSKNDNTEIDKENGKKRSGNQVKDNMEIDEENDNNALLASLVGKWIELDVAGCKVVERQGPESPNKTVVEGEGES